MLRTHRTGKGPGGCGVWGLGTTEQKGPKHASGLRGQGTPPGSPVGFPAWVGGAAALCSSPAPLVLESPSCLPPLFSPSLPPTPPGPTWPRVGFWGCRTRLKSSADFPGDWTGEALSALPPGLSPRASLHAWQPLPPLSLPSGVPVLSSLHFSSPLSPPTSYRFAWGFLPSPWASRSPTSIWQVP